MPIDEKYAQLWGKWHDAEFKGTQANAAMRETRNRDHRAYMQAASESRHWYEEANVAKILAAQYLRNLGWNIAVHKWVRLPPPERVLARPAPQPPRTNSVAAKPLAPAAVNPDGEAQELVPLPRIEKKIAANQEQVETEQPDHSRTNSIPAHRRSRPMGVAEAAREMGLLGKDKAVGKRFRRMMDDNPSRWHKENRKNYVFDLEWFPDAESPKPKT